MVFGWLYNIFFPSDAPTAPGKKKRSAGTSGGEPPKKKAKVSTPSWDWDTGYKKLSAYYKKYGTVELLVKDEKEKELFAWLTDQRIAYKRTSLGTRGKHLTGAQIEALEEFTALPAVPFKSRAEKWDEMYARAKAYKKKNGHLRIAMTDEDQELAKWARYERIKHSRFMRGMKPASKPEELAKLNKIGFEWNLRRGRQAKNAK